jgi:hypothetical protein
MQLEEIIEVVGHRLPPMRGRTGPLHLPGEEEEGRHYLSAQARVLRPGVQVRQGRGGQEERRAGERWQPSQIEREADRGHPAVPGLRRGDQRPGLQLPELRQEATLRPKPPSTNLFSYFHPLLS